MITSIRISLFAALALFSLEACSMGKLYLFSEVEGVVVDGGAPVAGAVIEREYVWEWNDKRGSDRIETDASGRFKFPAITGSSLMASLLPHEPAINQKILIRANGQTYEGWISTKPNYTQNGELDGKPIKLHCDLKTPPKRTSTGGFNRGFFGICELR
jgi:hypothetical protein